jgi:hypothetical protein
MGETIRVQHSKDYTVIANAAIRDTRLSFKARGLHHLLLSYPDGWEINTEHLSDQSESDGKTSVCSALKELEKFGYLTREQARVNGRMAGWKSVIREIPSSEPSKKTQKARTARVKPESGFPATENPATENPATENPATENPATENPATENPATENPATENLPHNKYLFQEVFKKEISKEEVSSGLPPAKEDLKQDGVEQISVIPDLKEGISGRQINLSLDKVAPAAPARLDKANVVEPFGRPRKSAKDIAWEWLPDGPWKKNGQLDNDFWQWFALEWAGKFGTDIHESRANVYSHLKKDHNNLEIRWKEYSIKTKKEVALVPLPDAVLIWQPIQHQAVWEQYINCKSLEDFCSKRSWNRAYLDYALINQPRFDWSKHLPSA